MNIYLKVFFRMLAVLSFLVAIFGLCFPGFFQAHAIVIVAITMTFLGVSGLWLILITWVHRKTTDAPHNNGLNAHQCFSLKP